MKVRQKNAFFCSYGALGGIIFIWIFAFLLSSPLFLFNTLNSMQINLNEDLPYLINTTSLHNNINKDDEFSLKSSSSFSSSPPSDFYASLTPIGTLTTSVNNEFDDSSNFNFEFDPNELKLIKINHCIEYSPFNQSRLIYSYASLMVQYMLPFLIVGLAYGSIWWKLRNHRNKLKKHKNNSNNAGGAASPCSTVVRSANTTALKSKALKEKSMHVTPAQNLSKMTKLLEHTNTIRNNPNFERRRRIKMNVLLTFIAIIFCASWLPLNIFNILSDSKTSMIKASHAFYIINAICILLGMSSAVSNPFLYGFLNENFKREYQKLFETISTRFCSIKKTKNNNNSNIYNNANKQTESNRIKKTKIAEVTVFDETKKPKVKKIKPNNNNNNNNTLMNIKPKKQDEAQKLLNQRTTPIILINKEHLNENSN
jgi:hypothetical protein